MAREQTRPADWEAEEADFAVVGREARHLLGRSLRHRLRTLIAAFLITGAVVGLRARQKRTYITRIVFRVTEEDLDAATAPRPNAQLRGYIEGVAFTRPSLQTIIRKHKLYGREVMADPGYVQAIEAMRADIEVEVWRNYFHEQRKVDDAGRSARIAIRYRARNPEVSFAVAQELGQLVVDAQESGRVQEARAASKEAKENAIATRGDISQHQSMLFMDQLKFSRAPEGKGAPLAVDIVGLQQDLKVLEARLHQQEQRTEALDLRVEMERRQIGMRFELVDPGRVPSVGISRPFELAILGVIVLFTALPLSALGIGAFDRRVYTPADLRRLGLEPLGVISAFGGDKAFALRERLRGGEGGAEGKEWGKP